jgi:hypothetical protein
MLMRRSPARIRSELVLFACLLAELPLEAAPEVAFRKEPNAAEQLGGTLIDAKGNRVLADSLRAAEYVVVVRGRESDPATRDFLPLLSSFARDPKHAARVEVVALDANENRDSLLRLLRAANLHWYGVEPGSTASATLAQRMTDATGPSLLALSRKGEVFASTGAQSQTPEPADLLRALEKQLSSVTLPPAELAAEAKVEREARRARLAALMKTAPAQVSDDELRSLYPVDGVMKVKGTLRALINQRVVHPGDVLDNGARVIAIEGQNVVIEAAGRRIVLEPAPIKGASGTRK